MAGLTAQLDSLRHLATRRPWIAALRWALPLAMLVILVGLQLLARRQLGLGQALADEDAYANLAVLQCLDQHGTYGFMADTPIPAHRDVLWRLVLWLALPVAGSPYRAAVLAGVVCAGLTLLVMARLARLLFSFRPFTLYTMLLVTLIPGFLPAVISGSAAPLATLLVSWACLLHIEGLLGRHPPLSVNLAFAVGLACWVRIEFGLLWLLFALHAGLIALATGSGRERARFDLLAFRVARGLLLIAVYLVPLVIWNLTVIQAPWARLADTSLTLGAPGGGPFLWLRESLALVRWALPESYRLFAATPLLAGAWALVLFAVGAVVLLVLGLAFVEERAFTLPVLAAVVLPAGCAVIYPWAGFDAAPLLYSSLAPVLGLVIAFGVFRLPFLVASAWGRWRQARPETWGINAWLITMGSIVLALCALESAACVRETWRNMADHLALRDAVARQWPAGGEAPPRCLTDAPGWLAWYFPARIMDVQGMAYPPMLKCHRRWGALDADRLMEALRAQPPELLLLTGPRPALLLEILVRAGARGLAPAPDAPCLVTLAWPAAP